MKPKIEIIIHHYAYYFNSKTLSVDDKKIDREKVDYHLFCDDQQNGFISVLFDKGYNFSRKDAFKEVIDYYNDLSLKDNQFISFDEFFSLQGIPSPKGLIDLNKKETNEDVFNEHMAILKERFIKNTIDFDKESNTRIFKI